MTRYEVIETFADLIEEHNDEEVIVVQRELDEGFLFISVDDFVETFAEHELTYESLKTHEYFNAGWAEYFERWKNEGYIK